MIIRIKTTNSALLITLIIKMLLFIFPVLNLICIKKKILSKFVKYYLPKDVFSKFYLLLKKTFKKYFQYTMDRENVFYWQCKIILHSHRIKNYLIQ